MTEIKKIDGMVAPVERFVLHWGDLGSAWGVNRSIAQIHALLLASAEPLHAEAISDALSIARSNVSNSLKTLLEWGLVRRSPVKGDRRDHFEAIDDMWATAARIVDVRKSREIDPAKEILTNCLNDAENDPAVSGKAIKRLQELQTLVALLDNWYAQMKDIPPETLIPLLRMGTKIIDLIKPFIKTAPSSAISEVSLDQSRRPSDER
ncbi:MAG: MarR family transcriptional regulator [Pseudomonadota bacterium]